MAEDSETPPNNNRNILREKKVEMAEAKSQYRYARNRGQGTDVSRRHRVMLATALMNYYDAVWEYVDDDQEVHQAWQKYDMDTIQEIDAETVAVEVGLPGDSAASETVEESKLVAQDPETLIEWSKRLDYFAKKLGLGKDVDTTRPTGRIGGEERYE